MTRTGAELVLGDIDLVVFDFDGTLVDTAPVICEAFSGAVRGTAAERPPEAFRHHLGEPLEWVFEHLQTTVPGFEQDLADFLEGYRVAHDAIASQRYALFDGVASGLSSLGCGLAIASTKPTDILTYHARQLGIAEHFDHIQGTDGFAFKPDPEILYRVWRQVPAEPPRTVFVGDSTSDMKAGRAAGARTLGVGYGAHAGAALTEAGALAVFDTFPQLVEYLAPRAVASVS